MTFLRAFFSLNAILLAMVLITSSSVSQELPDNSYAEYEGKSMIYVPRNNAITKSGKAASQSLIFTKLGELQNAYSYFSNGQQPFVYHEADGKLLTIKRGEFADDGSNGDNHLNNLFVLYSEDWGKTWSEPLKVYDNTEDSPWQNARYPSLYPTIYDGEPLYAYTSPITGGEGWLGFLTGAYVDGIRTSYFSSNESTEIDGKKYVWSTDSKIVAGDLGDDEPYMIAVGEIMPPAGSRNGDLSDNNNLALRYTYDFSGMDLSIPSPVTSDLFIVTENDSTRSSYLHGLEFSPSGAIFLAYSGYILASDRDDRLLPAFAKSEDQGQTWSEPVICPFSAIEAFAVANGLNKDSTFIPSVRMDFAIISDENVSFACRIRELNGTNRPNEMIAEVNYNSGVWTVRKISDITGYYAAYLRDNSSSMSNNQMGIELQISVDVDRDTYLTKWVDLVGLEFPSETTYSYSHSEIKINTRDINANTWSEATSISDDEFNHRITWIPDLLPADLLQIPVLEVRTIGADQAEYSDMVALQRELESERQEVMIGYFDAVVGVEEEENISTILEVNEPYPNPVKDVFELTFKNSSDGMAKIEIYDLFGNKVKSIYDSHLDAGAHAMTIRVDRFISGNYYIVVSVNGQKVTRQLRIVK